MANQSELYKALCVHLSSGFDLLRSALVENNLDEMERSIVLMDALYSLKQGRDSLSTCDPMLDVEQKQLDHYDPGRQLMPSAYYEKFDEYIELSRKNNRKDGSKKSPT